MRYVAITHVSPEEVLQRAKEYFIANTKLQVSEESRHSITFTGDLGTAKISVDREHGQTNVHASTDRVVGLDITDVTKRFLYTLGRA